MGRFRDALEECQLCDLSFEGDMFTWRNQSHCAEEHIRERLDRALANNSWRIHFPAVRVINGDSYHSDHRPVIITTDKPVEARCREKESRTFKFEASWLGEEKCAEAVVDAWRGAMERGTPSVHDALKEVARGLSDWSTNVLGDLEKTVKYLKIELERCRRGRVDKHQVAKEEKYRLEKLEEQIDVYWRQRAHVRWLEKGDRNTAFFHAVCAERMRRNFIGKLKKENGEWVEGEGEKKIYVKSGVTGLCT